MSGAASGAVAGAFLASRTDVELAAAVALGVLIGWGTAVAARAALGCALSDALHGRGDPAVEDPVLGTMGGMLLAVGGASDAGGALNQADATTLVCCGALAGWLTLAAARAGVRGARAAVWAVCAVPIVSSGADGFAVMPARDAAAPAQLSADRPAAPSAPGLPGAVRIEPPLRVAASDELEARRSTLRGFYFARATRLAYDDGDPCAARRAAHVLAARAAEWDDAEATMAAAHRLVARTLEGDVMRGVEALDYQNGAAAWGRRAGATAVLPWLEGAHEILHAGGSPRAAAFLLEEAMGQAHTPAQAREIEALLRRVFLREASPMPGQTWRPE